MVTGVSWIYSFLFLIKIYQSNQCRNFSVNKEDASNNITCPDNVVASISDVDFFSCLRNCLQRSTCNFINHQESGSCDVGGELCVTAVETSGWTLLKTQTDASTCIAWQPVENIIFDQNRVIKFDTGGSPDFISCVARLHTATETLPAKWARCPDEETSHSVNSNLVRASSQSFEVAVVASHCVVTWVPYDASLGGPLPGGAYIGGRYSDDSPLYVARVPFIYAGYINLKLPGYYSSSLGRGFTELYGIESSTTVDILVVY